MPLRDRPLIAASITVALGAGALVWFVAWDKPQPSRAHAHKPLPAEAATLTQAVAPSAVGLATMPELAIHDVAPVNMSPPPRLATEVEFQRELERLEARARTRGMVSDELAQALQASKRLDASVDPDRLNVMLSAFGGRMSRLKTELALQPVMKRLDALATQVHASADSAAIARAYEAEAQKLPEPLRIDAMDRLSRALASH